MALGKVKVLAEACQVIRPVLISVIAIGIVACAMAAKGWQAATVALGAVLVLIAAAMVLQVHRAITHLHQRSVSVQQSACEAEEHYVSVLLGIVTLAEARERYTEGHSRRVGRLSERIARELNLPDRTCSMMNLAGQLHDIGMLAIPEHILARRSRVGNEASNTIRTHSEIGYEMLRPLQSLSALLPAIRHHHERMNGTGYPGALAGGQIPMEARILAVADAYDAMTHDRPFRAAMSSLCAMRELQRCCPSGYDGDCVEALARIVDLPTLEEALAPAGALGA